MIRRIVLCLTSLVLPFMGGAQVNYVLNASLERYSHCPEMWDSIRLANFWSQIDTINIDPIGSPEYCNACCSTIYVGVPMGSGYNHYPRTGKGMASVQMYSDETWEPFYKRDYLQGRLATTLTMGKSYCVTFFVTLEQSSNYAIGNIGAYLDDGSIDNSGDTACAQPQTSYTPQILETSIINDTLNWAKVQGQFTASGNEKFITIGNFFDKAHTPTVTRTISPSGFTWYLVDDVSVIESNTVADAGHDTTIALGDSAHIGTNEEGMPCTWYQYGSTVPIGYSGGIWVKPDTSCRYVVEMDLCGNVTYDTVIVLVGNVGVKSVFSELHASVYPNPAKDKLTIEDAPGTTVTICDFLGRSVTQFFISEKKQEIDISSLPNEVYTVQISDKETGARQIIKIEKE